MHVTRVFPPDFTLLLASRSPRRRDLLDILGVPHRVVQSRAVEEAGGDDPVAVAEGNALAKAREAVLPEESVPGVFVLGTDTVVVIDDLILGKPADADEAGRMLERLAGRPHQVISGVALLRLGDGRRETALAVDHAITTVYMSALPEAARSAYLASGEWQGKAGAYAIQGLAALMVDRIEGDYANVVGLPVALLGRLFRSQGFDLLQGGWVGSREGHEAHGRKAGIIPRSGTTRQEV